MRSDFETNNSADKGKHLTASAAESYKAAGVDLERGYEVQRRIKDDLAKTDRPGVMASLGRFGGLFDLSELGQYEEPVLVSGTDGVGTKLFLAFQMDKHDTIGQDVVAMCVNDVLVQGAEPLFFLDYLALAKAEPDLVQAIVHGVAKACKESGAALIGGETAEMNDLYADGHYDIAGFAVGIVEKSKLITGDELKSGDVLLGLSSSGVHSNGFSLVRKIFFKDHDYTCNSRFPSLEGTLGEVLLTPTRLYVKPVLAVLEKIKPHAMCHITGGGFYENLPRMSEKNFCYEIKRDAWYKPEIFSVIQELGKLSTDEMYNVFNMGIGFVLALAEEDVEETRRILHEEGQDSFIIGQVKDGDGLVFV